MYDVQAAVRKCGGRQAAVLQIFSLNGKKKEKGCPGVGCRITGGKLSKSGTYLVFRNEEKIFEGGLLHLKHFKEEVSTLDKGNECSLMFEGFSEPKVGDILQCVERKTVTRVLDDRRQISPRDESPKHTSQTLNGRSNSV